MKKEDCIFCKIANGEIPSKTLYEDERFRVILDMGPAAKGHALVLPKEHFANLYELPEDWCRDAFALAKRISVCILSPTMQMREAGTPKVRATHSPMTV